MEYQVWRHQYMEVEEARRWNCVHKWVVSCCKWQVLLNSLTVFSKQFQLTLFCKGSLWSQSSFLTINWKFYTWSPFQGQYFAKRLIASIGTVRVNFYTQVHCTPDNWAFSVSNDSRMYFSGLVLCLPCHERWYKKFICLIFYRRCEPILCS